MATANCLNAHSRKTGSSLVHCKNLSTISNVTLFTSTTLHSQPTEPLHVATPQTINYDDQLNDMSRNGDETIGWLPCEAPLMIDDNPDDGPINEVEKKSHLAMDLQRPLKQRKQWFKLSLQASLCELISSNFSIWHCRRSILIDLRSWLPHLRDVTFLRKTADHQSPSLTC